VGISAIFGNILEFRPEGRVVVAKKPTRAFGLWHRNLLTETPCTFTLCAKPRKIICAKKGLRRP
jgi:hypothetical protein